MWSLSVRRYAWVLMIILSPRASAEWFDIGPLDAIQLGIIGLLNGEFLEKDRHGVKGTFEQGSLKTTVDVKLSAAQVFRGTIYVPVKEAHFQVLSPDGKMVFDSRQEKVKANFSKVSDAKHPWALYYIPSLETFNLAGNWQVVIQYDAALKAGALFVDIQSYSPFNAKFNALTQAVTTEKADLSVNITTTGTVKQNAVVSIRIALPDHTEKEMAAFDGGIGEDKIKGDGIYTPIKPYFYPAVGKYQFKASVGTRYLGKDYPHQAYKNIEVSPKLATVNRIQVITASDTCIEHIILRANINFHEAGTYDLFSVVDGGFKNGKFGASAGQRITADKGAQVVDVIFSKKSLMASFAENELITFRPLLVQKTDYSTDGLSKDGLLRFNAVVNPRIDIPERFSLKEINFCRDMIEIDEVFSIKEQLVNGSDKVSALALHFQIHVNETDKYGYYVSFFNQMPVMYESAYGGFFHEKRLVKGLNQVVIRIPASRLKGFMGGEIEAQFTVQGKGKVISKKLTTTTRRYQESDL